MLQDQVNGLYRRKSRTYHIKKTGKTGKLILYFVNYFDLKLSDEPVNYDTLNCIEMPTALFTRFMRSSFLIRYDLNIPKKYNTVLSQTPKLRN